MNRSLSLLLAAPLAVLSLVGCSAVDRADEAARVLDQDGAVIPGLHAAGEMIGGLFYFNYPGGSTTGHPWGTIPGTNQWINYRTLGKSDPGAGPTTNQTLWYLYRVRFTVPADAVNPKMTFSLKADNFAQVAINGNLTGGSTRFINGANMPNVIEG